MLERLGPCRGDKGGTQFCWPKGLSVAARTDIAILHEIVRVIEKREKVPERVRVRTKQYQITYLDDHRQRLEEAIRRRDSDRLGMLFGQLQENAPSPPGNALPPLAAVRRLAASGPAAAQTVNWRWRVRAAAPCPVPHPAAVASV